MTSHADLPQKGDLIAGKYQVEDLLGQGGMGVVVAARHLALRQRVAIKFLLPAALSIPGARGRFLREAQVAAALRSEHVARVLDVGTLETGAPYMVIEYLSGTDLGHLIKSRGSLPITEAVDLVLQAIAAIAEAHALGIVHRDLKPQNLFLATRPGAPPLVKVLDFGLSKIAPEAGGALEVSLTATDVVMGSVHYMSPEQMRSLKHVDARTDVWALGVILYRFITGCRPFDGDSLPAICASIIADVPTPLRAHRPEVPAPLDTLVLRCLEKDLARRVPSVIDLAQGLAPFGSPKAVLAMEHLIHVPASAPAAPPAPATTVPAVTGSPLEGNEPTTARLSTWGKTQGQPRQRATAVLVAGGVAALSVMIATGVVLQSRAKENAGTAEAGQTTVQPAEEVSVVPSAPLVEATGRAAPPEVTPPAASATVPAAAPSASVSASAPRPKDVPAPGGVRVSGEAPPPPAKTAPAPIAKPPGGQSKDPLGHWP